MPFKNSSTARRSRGEPWAHLCVAKAMGCSLWCIRAMAKKKSNPVSRYLSKIGQKGGKAGKGAAKARSSEQARAAVNKRWEKKRAAEAEEPPQPAD